MAARYGYVALSGAEMATLNSSSSYPTSKVVPKGDQLGFVYCVNDNRYRFEKITAASMKWADGTTWNLDYMTVMGYYTHPGDCLRLDIPVPIDTPTGYATLSGHGEYQSRDSGDYQDFGFTIKYWIGPDPEPELTVSHTTLCFGENVGVSVEYQTPGVQVDAFLYVGDRFVGYWSGAGDDQYRVALTVQLLNRWSNLIGYTGTGRLVVVNHWDSVTREYMLTVKAPFYWAKEQPYEGATVTYRETYQGYTIYYLSGPGIYGALDPYGNEMQSYAGSVSGAHTLIDNWLGAVYTLTITSNMDTPIQVGEHTVQTNSSITLLNGCYVIEAPPLLMAGGAPYVINYMQNTGTAVQFPGPSIVQCLSMGPVSTHIEYMGAEQDILLETYRGVEVWYDYRQAMDPPYDKCLYAKVEGHGKWFPITDYMIADVRAWIDVELDTPKNTSITIAADKTVIDEGESVAFTGTLRRTDTGSGLPDMPVTVHVNGEPSEGKVTDSNGTYVCSIVFPYPGTYTVTAVFEGYETLSSAAAETRVTTGGGSTLPLLAAAGAAYLLVSGK